MIFNKNYYTILCFLFSFQLLVGQDLSYEQYTDKDGLPSMKIYDIVQDSSMLLWMGTENGLVSYDGDQFVRHSHPDLLDNDIIEIALNQNGRLYFLNLGEQFGYVKNDEMILIEAPSSIDKIYNIISENGRDYLMTQKNSSRFTYEIKELSDGKFEFIPKDIYFFLYEENETFSRIELRKFIKRGDQNIISIDDESVKHFYSSNQRFNFKQRYYILRVDQTLYDYNKEIPYQRIVKNGDNFFIVKEKGVTHYNSKIKTFHNFLDDLKVNTMFIDSENNAWITTPSKGLLRIPNLVAKLNQDQPKLPILNGVNDIFQDKNGNIYLGLISNEVIINPFENAKAITITENQRPVQFIEYNDKVIAFSDKGASIIDNKTLKHKTVEGTHIGPKTILVNGTELYIGTTGSIVNSEFDAYFSSYFTTHKNIYFNGNRISNIYKNTRSTNVYVGTTKGLFRTSLDSIDLMKKEVLQASNVSCIIEGMDNTIWVGTRTNGIYNIKEDSIISNYSTAHGLISNNINNIELHDNNLLISTNSGLCIMDIYSKKIEIISEYNFLPSNEVLVCKVIDNEYWIGTQAGLTIISKEDIYESKTKDPFLSLKSVFINGVKTKYTPNMELDHTVNNIQLNLQNISYKSGKGKYIKYRIPLIDTSWITTNDSYLRLPSLKPGKYHIEAFGINSIGLMSDPLNIYFKINLPWWKTTWAIIMGVVLLLGLGNLIMYYRNKRFVKEEATKREYLTQINKIKDQALQLQMNPHFIFNSLNAIQGFIGTDEEEKAMNYLARFARLIRLIFEHSKGNTISLEEELEFVQLYLDLEKLRFKDKVNIDIMVDENIQNSKDIIKLPPLLIQPIIENSFKHGLFHKKGKGNLRIDYSMKGKLLQVTIEDDGIGREAAKKIAMKNNEKQTSSGIKTTTERIDLLNFNTKDKLNKILIFDLRNAEGNASGTKTVLYLSVLSSN